MISQKINRNVSDIDICGEGFLCFVFVSYSYICTYVLVYQEGVDSSGGGSSGTGL